MRSVRVMKMPVGLVLGTILAAGYLMWAMEAFARLG